MNLGLGLALETQHQGRSVTATEPTYIAALSGNAATGTTLTIDIPANIMSGDMLVAFVQAAGTDTLLLPAGWIQAAGGVSQSLFRRFHDGSASYTFATEGSSAKAAIILAYRSVSFGTSGVWNAEASTSPTPETIIVPADDSFIIAAVGNTAAGAIYTTPAEWALRAQVTVSRSIAVFERLTRADAGMLAGETVQRESGVGKSRAAQCALHPD